jgi:DNA primase
VGLCPFHDDHEPSLVVDAKKKLWNCLGACHEGGDVYRFVMKAVGVDFREAHWRLGGHEAESQYVLVEDQQWLERAVDAVAGDAGSAGSSALAGSDGN